MNKTFGFPLWIFVMICAASITSAAPLGTGFTYQGRLDMAGIPVNGTATMRFTLWDALSGGNRIGDPDTQINVPIANGLFVVLLNSAGQFGPNAFNGEARWLHVQVCSDPGCSSLTTLNPRQAITGAPYALGPWIRSASGNLSYSAGKVGIGTATPEGPLDVRSGSNSYVRMDDINGDVHFNGGDDGYFGFYNDSASGGVTEIIGQGIPRLTVANNGNIGVGTSAPAAKLDVAGDQALSGNLYFGALTRQMLNLYGSGFGIGIQAASVYFRSGAGYAWHVGGVHNDATYNSGGGTTLMTLDGGNGLVVNSNIRLGTNGQYFAPAAGENLRFLRGRIAFNGTILTGSGFQAARNNTGRYTITFDTPFSGEPTVTVSTEVASPLNFGTVQQTNANFANIEIYLRSDGSYDDGSFHFIAIGPR